MGWRGAVRSMAAAARAAERDAQRRHKRWAKEQMIADAAADVADWRAYIKELVSVHTNVGSAINWHQVATKPEPSAPVRSNKAEQAAQTALDNFRPRLIHRLIGGSEKRRQSLDENMVSAIAADDRDHEKAMAEYQIAVDEWSTDKELATRLLSGDETARRQVISEMQSLSSDELVGRRISFSFEGGSIHAEVEVHGDDIVPTYRRKQLQSGKLSQTKMPIGEFNELYQDYVCSVAIRIAGDVFNLIPIEEVYITCSTLMLNSATGHQEITPIVSVRFVRETFNRLNLRGIDPSDSLSNFVHEMDFKKTKGFSPIEPVMLISD